MICSATPREIRGFVKGRSFDGRTKRVTTHTSEETERRPRAAKEVRVEAKTNWAIFPLCPSAEGGTGLKRLQGEETKPDTPTGGRYRRQGFPVVAVATDHLIKTERMREGL